MSFKPSPVTITPRFISFSGVAAVDASCVEVIGRVGRVNNARAIREKFGIVSSHVVFI